MNLLEVFPKSFLKKIIIFVMNDKWEGNLKTLSKAKILISQLQDFWNFFIWTYLVFLGSLVLEENIMLI